MLTVAKMKPTGLVAVWISSLFVEAALPLWKKFYPNDSIIDSTMNSIREWVAQGKSESIGGHSCYGMARLASNEGNNLAALVADSVGDIVAIIIAYNSRLKFGCIHSDILWYKKAEANSARLAVSDADKEKLLWMLTDDHQMLSQRF
mgnify:CR=1 FL=1